MNKHSEPLGPESHDRAINWVRVLADYREPYPLKSIWVVANSIVPFCLLWGLALWVLDDAAWLSLLLSIPIGFLLMRIFCLQHDAGHHALFRSRTSNNVLGRALSFLTITPYALWRKMHDMHHAHSGNLSVREMGEVRTLTVAEFRNSSRAGRWLYRAYRHKLFLFGLAPFLLFFLQYRLPVGLWSRRDCWISAMTLNVALLVGLSALVSFYGGFEPVLLIWLPSLMIAASAGVFTFYVQHQFEFSHWRTHEDWQLHEAALHGSSYVVMPGWLAWFTAHISIHHVHHLYSKIPFYRLPEALRDHPELAQVNRMSLGEAMQTVNFHLWDESASRMVSFCELDKEASGDQVRSA